MTQSVFPPDFFQQIEYGIASEGAKMLRTVFKAALPSLLDYAPYVIGFFFIILMIVLVKAMMGRTGALASLLYHFIYSVILIVIVWIKGFEILFNPCFDVIYALFYPVSYFLTRFILIKSGIWKY